jgi:hypothetical protein
MPPDRSDSKLGSLSPAQKEQLREWLWEESPRPSLKKVCERIEVTFGIEVNASSLCEYRKRHNNEYEIEATIKRISTARQIADGAIADDYARALVTEQVSLDLIRVKLFNELKAERPDLKAVAIYCQALGDTNKLALKREQLLLDVQKFQFDAAKAALEKLDELTSISQDGALNDDAKINAVCEKLFGKSPQKETA